MASGPRITSRELMLKTVAEGSVKRKKEPDRDEEVVFYYIPRDILGNLKDPLVVDMVKGKRFEISTKSVVSALKKNKESQTVVENPVMVRDLSYPVRYEICKMLNVTRTLGGDFKTLAGALGMTTQNIRLISVLNDPADEVLIWWETQKSATVQNLRLKLQEMRRDDIVEVLEEDQEPAQERKTCSEQILQLNCASLNCPGNTDEKILVIFFGERLEVLATRDLLKRVKIGLIFEIKDSPEFPAPRNSEVSCVEETNNNQESIVTGNSFELHTPVKQVEIWSSTTVKAFVAFALMLVAISSCHWLCRSY